MEHVPGKTRFVGRRMVVLAFLAKNCAIGLNLGIYGTLVGAIGAHYHTSRTLAGSGLALMMLGSGLASPLVGWLSRRYTLRAIMMSGATFAAIGYGGLAFAPDIRLFLLLCVVPVGLGVALLGVIPASNLVCNWYVRHQGRALGIANMPLFIFLFPFLSAALVHHFGLRTTLFVIAGLFASLCLLLAMIVDRPADIGQRSWGSDAAGYNPPMRETVPTLTTPQVVRDPLLYLLTMAIGLMGAEGLTFVTHIVPLAVDRGIDLQTAASLVSAYGLSCSGGAILFGWLSDRIGPRKALAAQVLSQLGPWSALLLVGDVYILLLLLSSVMGICSGATATLFGAVANRWFGTPNVSLAMGLSYVMQVPLLFGGPWMAGYLYDRTGSYTAAILTLLGCFVVSGATLLLYRSTAPRVPD